MRLSHVLAFVGGAVAGVADLYCAFVFFMKEYSRLKKKAFVFL